MSDFEKPLRTLEDARLYFQGMGCSHFHMLRELPERYEEYRALGVSDAVERAWRREEILREEARLADEACPPQDYWAAHSSLEALVRTQRDPERLVKLHELTELVAGKVSDRDAVIVAETILGRGIPETRSGLVYFAYDLGRKDLAASFAERALALCARANGRGEPRTREALELCARIKAELSL